MLLYSSAGVDYEHLNETFTIQGGETKCLDLFIIDDNRPERYETVTIALNASNNAFGQFISQVTIVDNDGMYSPAKPP